MYASATTSGTQQKVGTTREIGGKQQDLPKDHPQHNITTEDVAEALSLLKESDNKLDHFKEVKYQRSKGALQAQDQIQGT
jgi:hypothetical protein